MTWKCVFGLTVNSGSEGPDQNVLMRQADLDLRCRIVLEEGFAWSRPVHLLSYL